MTADEIKRFLTALDMGEATDEQRAAAAEHAPAIRAWCRTPEGERFLFGPKNAERLREATDEERDRAAGTAFWFCDANGIVSPEAVALLSRLLMDTHRRGFAVGVAEAAADSRSNGVVLSDEGRAARGQIVGQELTNRRHWLRKAFDRVRHRYPAGASGDKDARAEIIRDYRRKYGDKLSDRTVRRDLAACREVP